jgi:hypothetical protein
VTATRRDRKVRLDYAFDRLLITKLQQAYEILVPHQVRAVRDSVLNGDGDEERSDLRVSSDKQKEENTIASQTSALVEFARKNGYAVPDEWVVEDEGFSGRQPGATRTRTFA